MRVRAFVTRSIAAGGRVSSRPGQRGKRRASPEHGCTPQRHSCAEGLEQNEIREQAADHRAERVQSVEHGQPPAAHVFVHLHGGHGGGHGTAHEQGWATEHQGAQCDTKRGASKEPHTCAAPDFHVQRAYQPQKQGRQCRK